ncbi:DUF501 domain-containing protein [Halanaerobium congolense]|uniref:DUF501 domain-containing protein n=1 Tax=Halanaerobium congolense TaxID=54121 RepID=UPI001060F56B|nr:DUF501 domain-containing protein [Halanaerobium congolense]TDP13537.1 hypothetical protein C8C79_12527 [Halanaerobium congolense]
MNEHEIIELQLDRKINNFLKIAKFCPFDYPAVIIVNPFVNCVPAPTIYWLSCPHLNYEVDRLEAESNLISKLQGKLKYNPKFKNKMIKTHEKYAEQRKSLLSAEQLAEAKSISEDLYNTLMNSGVGGIKEKEGIKCLHTHLADFLVDKFNPAGEIVFSKINWPDNCQICKERVDQFESSSN